MSKLKLKSDYKPTGDQPDAIAQLNKGLDQGDKQQTLLGVTGSGKSVVSSTKILCKRGDKTWYLPIGELDATFANPLPVDDNAVQVVDLENAISTVSLDSSAGQVLFSPVAELSRHRYRGSLYSVETACGRTNTFTDSHNLYALRDGELTLVKSEKLQIKDWLPIPDKLPESQPEGLSHIDAREWLPEDCYIQTALVNELLPAMSKQKAWRVINKDERIKLKEYRLLEGKLLEDNMDRVGYKLKSTIPVRIPSSRDLWRFLGLYIAEGHSTGSYIVLSTADSSIVNEFKLGASSFGLKIVKRQKVYDYQISSKILAGLLIKWCGARSQGKHLPVFWPQCSNQQLGQLLSGIYAGDGWVEPQSVCLGSSSKELIEDTQCALLRFGIHARTRFKKVKYKEGFRNFWVLSIYGQDLRLFRQYIGFGLERKDEQLSLVCSTLNQPNTNVDIFPLPSSYVKSLCHKYGLYQKDIAVVAGTSRSLVSFYLDGKRLPARWRARKILDFLLDQARIFKDNQDNLERLEKLLALTNFYWSPIKSITVHAANTVVYDLAVPSSQTFLAGSYFVHNTFTMSNVIEHYGKPTLVLSHNKTLAAQLYNEFKNFFPDNAVHYFVSYFDYYQPEAYIPRSDTYIEKDSQINEEIDRLRHAATDALLSRKDVIIVASVSCIYGIGSVEDYNGLSIEVKKSERKVRDKFLRQLTDIQYQRNDIDFHRSTFRVRGDTVDIFPASEELAYRVGFFGDEVERITQVDPLTGEILKELDDYRIFPGSHYVTPADKLKQALVKIEDELKARLAEFKSQGKLLEAQRLEQRTRFDVEMLEATGFVKGIENYSRYLTNREPGEQPATLMDYFPDDYLLLVDESHMTIPQVRGMYNGDRARKEVLVEHGFRLPSALDNRPLTFTEFERHINKAIYVSATPAEYELSRSPSPAQQIIRPTGLLDPVIEVRPIEGQIDDLINEIRATVKKRQRVLITTLTKRMSEDLAEYLQEINIKVAYLHSDIDTLDRTDILRDLRLGTYDVLVGINLLREGLDLPEVSLVAILDADKEGFLRSEQALTQTIGRAARHEEGRVLMYADHITDSMKRTIDKTNSRRQIQTKYNEQHQITPTSISREVEAGMRPGLPEEAKRAKLNLNKIPKEEYGELIKDLTSQMELASANLQFEQAAELRDLIEDIKKKL